MSTELGSIGDLSVTSFWGGTDRGPCLQITTPLQPGVGIVHGFSQLTREQVIDLSIMLAKWVVSTSPPEVKS